MQYHRPFTSPTFCTTIIAAFLALPGYASAATQRVDCPTELPQSSIRLADVPPGWKAYTASPLYLHSAGPAAAPPEKGAELKETSSKLSKSERVDTYKLEGPFPDGKWIQCSYGMLNEVTLSKRLKDNTSECTVTSRKGEKAGQYAQEITCR